MQFKVKKDEYKEVNSDDGTEETYKAVGVSRDDGTKVVISSKQPLGLQEGDEFKLQKIASQKKLTEKEKE